jgi:exosortase/archaeosortase
MKRFLENHPLIRVSVTFLGAVALCFAAYYHFTHRSFFLLLTDVPLLIGFVYLFFDGIADMLAASKPARPDSKDRKT